MLETVECRFCGISVEPTVKLLASGLHFSEKRCPLCSSFLGFGKKPKNEGKRCKNKHTPESLEISFCQMCLRPRGKIGVNTVLEVHHINEIQDGGLDIHDNILVLCTSCHRLTHHQRTYLNTEFQGKYTIEDLRRDMGKDNVPESTRVIMERIFLLWNKS